MLENVIHKKNIEILVERFKIIRIKKFCIILCLIYTYIEHTTLENAYLINCLKLLFIIFYRLL